MDQEQYLEGTSLRKIILRGIKKLVTEMTSTKFLLLVFIWYWDLAKVHPGFDWSRDSPSHHRDPRGPGGRHYWKTHRRLEMIQKLWTFAKGLPWWAWVLVGLAVLYLFNMASGSIYTRKLWNMLHDQIVQEDKAIQEELENEVTRLDQREKELIQENARIKKQLTAAHEEKRMLLGRLHEIETQLNAVASNLPPSTDLDSLAERFKKRGYSPVVLPRK